MDRRTLLAIILCFVIYMGWQKFYLEPRMPHQTISQSTGASVGSATSSTSTTSNTAGTPASSPNLGGANSNQASIATPATQTKTPSQTLTLESGTGQAVIGDGADIFKDWRLKGYHLGLSQETPAVDLAAVTNQSGEVQMGFDIASLGYLSSVQGKLNQTPQGADWNYEDANVKITRSMTTNAQQNYVDLVLNAQFKTTAPKFAFISLTLPVMASDPEERDRQFVYWTNDSLERVPPKKAELKQIISPVKYIGITSRYFLMAMVNQSGVEPKGVIQGPESGTPRISFEYPISGNSLQIPLRVYFGPKELDIIRAVDPLLDHTVDFGWFTIFAYPILRFLKFLYSYVGNFGLAIILLTVLLKIATYPLTYKSMKNMKEMAKLQPQLAKIREKYKDDKESLNREMMSVMKTHGANPLAGCLPMVIQMPIFFALYRVLYSSIDLYHAPFFGYIHDLSAKDPYYVTPVLMSLLMFMQQTLTPNTAADPAQQKMIKFMPLMFGVFMLSLPAGLTLYMLTNAGASIIQQLYLNKKLGITRNETAVATTR
jgi:YidC/Oxa1 family membrane protein insertase